MTSPHATNHTYGLDTEQRNGERQAYSEPRDDQDDDLPRYATLVNEILDAESVANASDNIAHPYNGSSDLIPGVKLTSNDCSNTGGSAGYRRAVPKHISY